MAVFEDHPETGRKSSSERTRDVSDSLHLYFRQLSDSEPVSAEEELALWKDMDQSRAAIRRILYQFGFLMPEHVKLYRGATPENFSDLFDFENDGDNPLVLEQWIREIECLYEKRREAFQCSEEKHYGDFIKQSVDLLSRYPANSDQLYEWYNVSTVYQMQLQKETEPIPQIEEKLLMCADVFLQEMDHLKKVFMRLEESRQRLLTANLRLVVSIARPFRRNDLQTGDLIQEGNLGLVKALERFDYRLGHKFSTYATWWIKQSISKSIAAQSRIIRLPAHMLTAISRINRAERQFIQKTGRDPSAEELASILEMPRERVSAIRKMAAQSISLQASVSDSGDSSPFEQFLCTDEEDNPVRQLAYKFLKDRLGKALERLTEREQQIITLHFGLNGNQAMSLLELSNIFGLTRERVRQIEMRALRKLRDPGVSSEFQDYF